MSITLAIVLVLVGFALLIVSADLLVDSASELAGKLGISTFLVGIIVVGFGTSAPELFVSAMAALENKGNLALGNALGSNITNIGLVLGCAALVRSLPVGSSTARRDIPMVIVAGIVSVLMILDGTLGNIDGIALLAILIGYLVWSANGSSNEEPSTESNSDGQRSLAMSIALTIGSIIILMIASRILVVGAVTIAEFLGVSELIIGLTVVAIGTSLPELAAAIAAARKGVHDMIIGNIIGSNIFNTLGVLGLTGALRATEIDTGVLWRDFPIMFAFTLFMFALALLKKRFSRVDGGIMLTAYLAYLGFLIVTAA